MTSDRKFWLDTMTKIAFPVIDSLSMDRLKAEMPVECTPGVSEADNKEHTYLEAFGRTVCGIAPWLEHKCEDAEEEAMRIEWTVMTRKALHNAVSDGRKDVMNFEKGGQPIVDAAFLAEGILRARCELWEKLDGETKRAVIRKMKATRTRKPCFSNWLLFSAVIEAFLCFAGEDDWDRMRIDYALRQFDQWYRGDGVYSDGPLVAFDYYNSYVIHPMLLDIFDALDGQSGEWDFMRENITKRAARFGAVLEELISPEGTYPIIGRSSAYRFGCFHHLALSALKKLNGKSPASVRSGLTAVIKRVTAHTDMFDENGWLTIGPCGHNCDSAESYISTGSLYLCCTVFLPLGLPESDPFWQDEAEDWTQKRIWNT